MQNKQVINKQVINKQLINKHGYEKAPEMIDLKEQKNDSIFAYTIRIKN